MSRKTAPQQKRQSSSREKRCDGCFDSVPCSSGDGGVPVRICPNLRMHVPRLGPQCSACRVNSLREAGWQVFGALVPEDCQSRKCLVDGAVQVPYEASVLAQSKTSILIAGLSSWSHPLPPLPFPPHLLSSCGLLSPGAV